MILGWVDFSHEARKQALDALSTLTEKGAVDELGIGVIRDAFADKLFPGTSTIQTRAKYFALVPCCVRFALEKGKGPLREELRNLEKKCCRQMWDNCGHDSDARVIGRRNLNLGDWVQRTPSEIYWAGLRVLGILRADMSRGLWLAHAERSRQEAGETEDHPTLRQEGIEDDEETRLAGWMGDWRLPRNIYQAFSCAYAAKELSPDLTQEEAIFLRKRIFAEEETKTSLMAWCLENGAPDGLGDAYAVEEELSPFGRFAQGIRHRVPAAMEEWLDLACAFNRLVFPARVLYNKILDVPGVKADSLWQRVEPQIPAWMENIDLAEIFRRAGVSPLTYLARFLTDLQAAFLKRDFLHAEKLIREREIAIKRRKRAKLLHPEKVEPGTWVGGGWLDYRLDNAGRILRDIEDGERRHA